MIALQQAVRVGFLVGVVLSPLPAAATDAAADPATTSTAVRPASDTAQDEKASGESLELVVVTGSHIQINGFSAPTPVTVLSASDIKQQGATNVADVLNLLPAFRPQATPATTGIFAANAGANLADLRGLGANRTLVLIDGRRVVASTVSGSGFSSANSVDLNLVPTTLIARTEVVTGGASAAYGSDAVAGVVNLILDTEYQGIKGSVQAGTSEHGDDHSVYGTLAAGTAFADGRGHVIFGGEYEDNKGTGDCYTREWCAVSYNIVTNPTPQTNGLARSILMPNTRAASATFGGLITSGPLRGTEFSSNGTTVAHDYGVYYATGPAFANGGLFQSGGAIDPVNPFYNNFPLSVPVRRVSTLAHGTFDFTDSLTGFAEASYADARSSYAALASRNTGNITIQRDNAFLPASVVARMVSANVTSFNFGRIGNDIGPYQANTQRNTFRATTGVNGKFGDAWKWDAYYEYGRTQYDARNENVQISDNFARAVDAVRAPDGTIVCRSTLTNPSNGCQPLDLFGQNNFSAAAVDYAYGTATQSTKLTQHVAAVNLSGELFRLPAGPVLPAAGAEYRVEDVAGTADPISTALRFANSAGIPISGPATKVKETYGELALPLVAEHPFFKELSLNGAVRLTDYSTTGSVTTWKFGGVWEPNSLLRLRATRSRDIRAPNFFELYSPNSFTFQTVTDAQRGGASFLVPVVVGGNIALKPEVAHTLTVGAVLSPLSGVQLSVDYFNIELDGAISTLGSQVIVDQCQAGIASLCSQVIRDGSGAITSIRNLNLNLNQMKTRGIDAEGSFSHPLGSLGQVTLRVLGTYLFNFITVDPAGTAIDRAGMNGAPISQPSGLPRFQGNANLTFARGPISATATVRYLSAGVYNATLIGPDQVGYSPVLANSISNNHVGSVTYVNLNMTASLIDSGSRRVELFGGVNNLLDRDPPNRSPSSFNDTNPTLYDVVGRTYRLGMRYAF
jgi:outer membrane receptor protein involved in Fe transport